MDEHDPAGAPSPPSGATGRLTPVPDKVRVFGRPLPERASRKNASPSRAMRRETGEGLYGIVEAVLVVSAIASTVSVAALALYVLFF